MCGPTSEVKGAGTCLARVKTEKFAPEFAGTWCEECESVAEDRDGVGDWGRRLGLGRFGG